MSKNQEVGLILTHSSSLVVEIDNSFFIDLPNIDGLSLHNNPSLLKNLNDDFGCITNGILMLSPFYSNHSFIINPEQ